MPTEELVLGEKTVVLVGTAHVSGESVKAVEDAIAKHKPDVVAVELCEQRYSALKNEKRWEETDILEVVSSGRTHLFLLQILLANFQRKIGEDVGVKPGAEMLKAIEVAEKSKAKVLLADRDIKVTLKRAMDSMSLREKVKVAWGFMDGFLEGQKVDEKLIEKLKEKDVLSELMEELAVETPSIKRVLVDERDSHIAAAIHMCDAKTIVAVVGAGHMEGVKRNLMELDAEEGVIVTHSHSVQGEEVKRKDGVMRKISAVSWLIVLAFAAILILGFVQHGGAMTVNMIVKWFLITGTCAAVGAALALSHPLTILSAFLAAPFTTLHPAIAAGWVAGYVELRLRKPRVIDFKTLMLLKSASDYWHNRVVKLVLVVAFTNLGASVGSFIGLTYMVSLI